MLCHLLLDVRTRTYLGARPGFAPGTSRNPSENHIFRLSWKLYVHLLRVRWTTDSPSSSHSFCPSSPPTWAPCAESSDNMCLCVCATTAALQFKALNNVLLIPAERTSSLLQWVTGSQLASEVWTFLSYTWDFKWRQTVRKLWTRRRAHLHNLHLFWFICIWSILPSFHI